jgi:hypothetical protein
MASKKALRRESEDIPLAHDAATWDEETFGTGWDDEQEKLVLELSRSDADIPGYAI